MIGVGAAAVVTGAILTVTGDLQTGSAARDFNKALLGAVTLRAAAIPTGAP
jgi:hypothetical protein